jgi:hypothetical protein
VRLHGTVVSIAEVGNTHRVNGLLSAVLREASYVWLVNIFCANLISRVMFCRPVA